MEESSSTATRWQVRVLVASLGACGAGAGLAWASRPSIWYDEAATLSAIRRTPGELLHLVGHVDAVHALYYGTAWAWSQVMGDGILALRTFSALGLGVTAALMFLLVDRLLTRRAAISAAVVAMLLPGLSWSGLEGRSYSWSAALAVLATYLLVVARAKGGRARWSVYTVVIVVTVWWSFFAGLMLLVHGVALAAAERRLRREWILSSAVAVIACLPLMVLVRSQAAQLRWIDQTPLRVVQNVAIRQVVVGQLHDAPGVTTYEWAAVGLAILLVATVVTWLRNPGTPRDPIAVPLVLTWAALPTAIVAGANLLGAQVYQPRYLTFSVPAVAIAVGAGLARLRGRSLLIVGIVGCALVAPVLAAHRALDAKSGDNYLRLARAARDSRADAVVFDRADLRGIAFAYPAMFSGIEDLSLARSPVRSHSLWGRNVRAARVRHSDVAGRTVVLYRGERTRSRGFAQRLHRLGCRARGPQVRTIRASAAVLQC